MGVRSWNIALLVGIGSVWFAGSTQHEKRIVSDMHTERVAMLEDRTAQTPEDAAKVRELVQAYLDAHTPGMAIASIERAPQVVRRAPSVEHLYARALLEQGRAADALAAERRVLTRCAEGAPDAPTCSAHLVASATRRSDILEQLVSLGVEDANAHPEASNLAYHSATRQISVSTAH